MPSPPRLSLLLNEHPLIHKRQVLIAAIDELTSTAREETDKGRDPEPYLFEATRLVLRLRALQEEIESHDLD